MFELFASTSADCSKLITKRYSTSFSLGIKTLGKPLRQPIYGIYGMVRYADEIVDTFYGFDQQYLLQKFKKDTFEAIEHRMSLNPILFSFQQAVNDYGIPLHLIEAFFNSMEMDLYEKAYEEKDYQQYVFGSAEVVGLMCLKVFANGDDTLYERLKDPARSLGSAFQKVNFLRDMKSDFTERGRIYFPGIDFNNFNEDAKLKIEQEITLEFEQAYNGIMQLPMDARVGVLLAYKYYIKLFQKIQQAPAHKIMEARIRVPDYQKAFVLAGTLLRNKFITFS